MLIPEELIKPIIANNSDAVAAKVSYAYPSPSPYTNTGLKNVIESMLLDKQIEKAYNFLDVPFLPTQTGGYMENLTAVFQQAGGQPGESVVFALNKTAFVDPKGQEKEKGDPKQAAIESIILILLFSALAFSTIKILF